MGLQYSWEKRTNGTAGHPYYTQVGDLGKSHSLPIARALIEGVPPAEQDHPATAADWLRRRRRAGLYELGRALYEKGGFDFSRLDEEAQLEVEEDYQLCVRRG